MLSGSLSHEHSLIIIIIELDEEVLNLLIVLYHRSNDFLFCSFPVLRLRLYGLPDYLRLDNKLIPLKMLRPTHSNRSCSGGLKLNAIHVVRLVLIAFGADAAAKFIWAQPIFLGSNHSLQVDGVV